MPIGIACGADTPSLPLMANLDRPTTHGPARTAMTAKRIITGWESSAVYAVEVVNMELSATSTI